MFEARLDFSEGLLPLVDSAKRTRPVVRRLRAKTSAKDLIESCGVPHTEVDRIRVCGEPVGFEFQVDRDMALRVDGVGEASAAFAKEGLQPRGARRFIADGHLGKLARNLRLLGFDTANASDIEDAELARRSEAEGRALLTRDRRLLMRRRVALGYCPCSDCPQTQTTETLRRFGLSSADFAPFSRCLRCNGVLREVPREAVADRLAPLTRRYYTAFRRCSGCGRVFWAGSHSAGLRAFVERAGAAADGR